MPNKKDFDWHGEKIKELFKPENVQKLQASTERRAPHGTGIVIAVLTGGFIYFIAYMIWKSFL